MTVRLISRSPISAMSLVAMPRALMVVRRVEFVHMGKFVSGEIIVRPQAQPGHQHICHADLQRVPVERLQIEVIQFLQQAVLPTLPQVLQVIRDVVRYGVVAGGAHRIRQIFFFGQVAEGSLQCFNDSRFKGRAASSRWAADGQTGIRAYPTHRSRASTNAVHRHRTRQCFSHRD